MCPLLPSVSLLPSIASDRFLSRRNELMDSILRCEFKDIISRDTVGDFIDKVKPQITKQQPSTLYVEISTDGGQFESAIFLYHFLIGQSIQTITHNSHRIYSTGILPFLGGKTRFATPEADFGIHSIYYLTPQDERLDQFWLEHRLNGVKECNRRVLDCLIKHTDISLSEAQEFTTAQNIVPISAKQALYRGIIHEIKELEA